MSVTIYCYVRFRKLRYKEFSPEWWGWLLATGTFMACTWASKVNGILTVVAIGVAVLIDLWDILDIKKDNSMVRSLRCARNLPSNALSSRITSGSTSWREPQP